MTDSVSNTRIDKVRSVVRAVIGIVLIVSAVAKALEFDNLELYIFSFGWFSLGVSFWLARLLVAAEVIVGIALLLGLHRRRYAWYALGMMGLFTAFMCYALIVGRNDNCHCMGSLVEFSPLQSLLKNVALIAALCFILPQRGGLHLRKWIEAVGVTVITLAIFIISPPDNINPHLRYDRVLNSAVFDTLPHHEGRRIICLYSTECHYCELTGSKIGSLVRRHNLEQNIEVWFAKPSSESDIADFWERTLSPSLPYQTLPIRDFMILTSGAMPIVLLVDGDSVVHEYNYRTINEGEICEFFGK